MKHELRTWTGASYISSLFRRVKDKRRRRPTVTLPTVKLPRDPAVRELLRSRSEVNRLLKDYAASPQLGANAAKVALESTQGHAFNACYICVALRLESRHQSADEKCHQCSKPVCSALHCEESYPDGLPICTVCETA